MEYFKTLWQVLKGYLSLITYGLLHFSIEIRPTNSNLPGLLEIYSDSKWRGYKYGLRPKYPLNIQDPGNTGLAILSFSQQITQQIRSRSSNIDHGKRCARMEPLPPISSHSEF